MAKLKTPPTEHFTRTVFVGYVAAVLIAASIALGLRSLLGLDWLQTSVIALIAFGLSAALVVWILHKELRKPLQQLQTELASLQQKVHTSTHALSSVSQKSTALQEALPFGLLVFDSKNQLSLINAAARRLLELDKENAAVDTKSALNTLNQLASNNQPIKLFDWVAKVKTDKIKASQLWPMAQVTTGPDTAAYDVIAHYNKQDSYGHELVIALIDRTDDFRRQEKQMEFIALAAHELRGPITVMRGLIDVFQLEVKEQLNADHQELLTRMAVSARQLSGYVDNILSVSRIDQQGFSVRLEKADWKTTVTGSTGDLAVRAKANHRSLTLKVPDTLPPVAIDPVAILHVINNLIDNAIKYSKADGEIIVAAGQKGDTVETTVQDSGIGMPGSVVEGLFTKFYRSHRSKQMVSGTGLGLYLCKAIVEAHGGNIWVRSTEGIGTTFGFTLPTYESVAQNVEQKKSEAENDIVRGSHGWIKNHALYRR